MDQIPPVKGNEMRSDGSFDNPQVTVIQKSFHLNHLILAFLVHLGLLR